jgi:virginiamycin B lyase
VVRGNQNATIGRIDGRTGGVDEFPMPDPAARDPHTMVFDAEGNLWFTVQQGNFVGRLTPASRKVELIKVPTPGARPYGIVIDRDGTPWIDLFGTSKLASIDPRTLKLTEHALPDAKARPRRIATTPDGFVWYDDFARGFLGRLDPKTGGVREWPMPGGPSSFPYAMSSDDRGRLWMVETGVSPNRLVGFDPEDERFFGSTAIPSGGGVVRHMVFDPKTRRIWFGTDKNTIGVADVGKAPEPVRSGE